MTAARLRRKNARSSSAQSSGSQTVRNARPRAGSGLRTTFAVRSSHARGGGTMSPGKREKPDGTSTRRASCAGGIAAFAWYMRIEEPIVPQ